MRLSTSAGFALLIVGFMLFGVATLPGDSTVPTTSSPSCAPDYAVSVSEKEPSPYSGPQPQEYETLTLSEQEAFQYALLRNGTTTVEEPVFENATRVYYEGTVYDVNGTEVPVTECGSSDEPDFGWHLWVFGLSVLAGLGGLGLLTRSLWNHL